VNDLLLSKFIFSFQSVFLSFYLFFQAFMPHGLLSLLVVFRFHFCMSQVFSSSPLIVATVALSSKLWPNPIRLTQHFLQLN
jgi:hypothetical protein